MVGGSVGASGELTFRVSRAQNAPWRWRLRNALRFAFLWGWLCHWLAKGFTRISGVVTITPELSIRVRKASGEWINYGVASYNLITDAAMAFLVDDLDNNGQDISLFNYHGCGTGTTAEAANQTALVTESTTALNPDSTRATGSRSQPSANVYRSVGTLTFDAVAAVTEHALMSQAATGGGTMFDRSVFSAINVGSGDSIQFTYDATFNSGG